MNKNLNIKIDEELYFKIKNISIKEKIKIKTLVQNALIFYINNNQVKKGSE